MIRATSSKIVVTALALGVMLVASTARADMRNAPRGVKDKVAAQQATKTTSDLSGADANTILMLVDEQKKATDFARDTLARLSKIKNKALKSDEGALIRELIMAKNQAQLKMAVAHLSARLGHDREKAEDQFLDWQEVMFGQRPMPNARHRKKAETTGEKLAEAKEIGAALVAVEKEMMRIDAHHRRILVHMPERSLWRKPLRLEEVFANHPWALRAAGSLYRPAGKPTHPIKSRVLGIDERGRVLVDYVDTAVITPLDKDRVLMTTYHDATSVPGHRFKELKQAKAREEGKSLEAKDEADNSPPSRKKEKTGAWVASDTTLVDATMPAGTIIDKRDVLNRHNRARLYGKWQNELQFEPAVHLHSGDGNQLRMIHLITGETRSMVKRPLELEALSKATSKDIPTLLRIAKKAASRQVSVPTPWHDEAPTPKALLEKSGIKQSYTRQLKPQRGRIVTKR